MVIDQPLLSSLFTARLEGVSMVQFMMKLVAANTVKTDHGHHHFTP